MDVHPPKHGINRYWSIPICGIICISHINPPRPSHLSHEGSASIICRQIRRSPRLAATCSGERPTPERKPHIFPDGVYWMGLTIENDGWTWFNPENLGPYLYKWICLHDFMYMRMGQHPCTLVSFKIAGQLPFVTQIFGPEVLTWTHTQGSLCISKGDPLYIREISSPARLICVYPLNNSSLNLSAHKRKIRINTIEFVHMILYKGDFRT